MLLLLKCLKKQDYGMDVYWNHYMLDGRFRGYQEDLMNRLVIKFDSHSENDMKGFLDQDFTERVLLRGSSAIISLWDMVKIEVKEKLLTSCAVHYFIDDYMQLNFG